MGKTTNRKKKPNKYDTTLKINGSADDALNALLGKQTIKEDDFINAPIGILQEDGTVKKTSFVYKNILEFLKSYYPDLVGEKSSSRQP